MQTVGPKIGMKRPGQLPEITEDTVKSRCTHKFDGFMAADGAASDEDEESESTVRSRMS